MTETLHKGHRKRIRQKILRTGLESFSDYEILEFLLFYAIPRKNTNELGHMLLNKFGTLSALSQASIEDICSIPGISKKSAAFIKYLPQIAEHIFVSGSEDGSDRGSHPILSSSADVTAFFRKEFSDIDLPAVKLSCLTDSLKLISTTTLSENGLCDTPDSMMKLISIIIENRSRNVIIACKHTNNDLIPSGCELSAIKKILRLLISLDINLVDIVIVSGSGIPMSLSDSGYLSNLRLTMQ